MFYVYILASLSGTLYVGLTDNLKRRVEEHKLGLVEGFTKEYKVNRLMYYEIFRSADTAAARERQIKKWRREKKLALFEDESNLGRFKQAASGIVHRGFDVERPSHG